MDHVQIDARLGALKQRAHGQWTSLLRTLGIPETILNKQNQPCPLCGGRDRFQYTDKFGDGNYHCRGCGAGTGIKLLQGVLHWDFRTLLQQLETCLGTPPEPLPPPIRPTESLADRMQVIAQRLWSEARPVAYGDDVDRYLVARGLSLTTYPAALRCHPALGYYELDATGTSRKVAELPAMLACIQGADGQTVTLHRTYIENGAKTARGAARKVLSSGINGAAVRLCNATDELAIAEGIETALAVHLRTGKPVWAAINAGNMEKLWLPETVRRLCIYADNDAHGAYDGQAAAFNLARRLRKQDRARHIDVLIPRQAGSDWADVWCAKLRHAQQTA